jgi:7,8-dihydropterin-6-yl-methyl-4-(beta-D-ribofuranosyl)aminobenzene 5'-phosphate synthase
VLTDDVSDNYVSKTLFAVSEFANVIRGGATVISGEALLCANLGFGLRLVSEIGGVRHTLLFDTGPEGAVFIRNCANLGIPLGEVEAIAVSHGHWDHMAALPAAIDDIGGRGGRVTVHVNPGMFDERAIRLQSGRIVPVAKVPLPAELESHGAIVVNSPDGCCRKGISITAVKSPGSPPSRRAARTICLAADPRPRGSRTPC